MTSSAHHRLRKKIVECRLCPRLVEHREHIARVKRRAYLDWDYWGRPVPSLGSVNARLLLVGLAPGAHGANRTGRMFTGDRSGELLYATLHRFGFCNQPESKGRGDGLRLVDAYLTNAVHCVPPGNRPGAEEIRNCLPFFLAELRMLRRLRVVVALGGLAFRAYFSARREMGLPNPRPLPRFGHGATTHLDDGITLIACYHPSQQNTQTGRLTTEMFEGVFEQAAQILYERNC